MHNKILKRLQLQKVAEEIDDEDEDFVRELESIKSDALSAENEFDNLSRSIEDIIKRVEELGDSGSSEYLRMYVLGNIKKAKQEFIQRIDYIQ